MANAKIQPYTRTRSPWRVSERRSAVAVLRTGILPALLVLVMSICLSTSADARLWKWWHVPTGPAVRLEAMEQAIDAARAAFNVVEPALQRFYSALDDEQKARLLRDITLAGAPARPGERTAERYGERSDRRSSRWRAYASADRNARNAATRCAESSGERALMNPITGIAGCCARAASGHAAAAPPMSVMNSRRLMRCPPGEIGTLPYC